MMALLLLKVWFWHWLFVLPDGYFPVPELFFVIDVYLTVEWCYVSGYLVFFFLNLVSHTCMCTLLLG